MCPLNKLVVDERTRPKNVCRLVSTVIEVIWDSLGVVQNSPTSLVACGTTALLHSFYVRNFGRGSDVLNFNPYLHA